MKTQASRSFVPKEAKSKKKVKRVDLSKCKLVAPYGRDVHALESLSDLITKVGTTKPGLRSVGETTEARKGPRQKATTGETAKGRRIDLSGCKLVAPYGRDAHALESLSDIARKMGSSKSGFRTTKKRTQAPKGAARQAKAGESAKRRRIDLTGCKLVAPYGRDAHALDSLSDIARKMGSSKGGFRSTEEKTQAPKGSARQAKAGESAKRRRIDLTGCKLVGPYGCDPHALEILSAMVTKVGTTKLGTSNVPPKD